MVRKQYCFDPRILREDGIRGVYGETLTLADAEVLGRAFGTLLREKGGRTVALAFDGRRSSPDIAAAVLAGLVTAGAQVLRVGRGSTPMLCFAVERLPTDAGVMVTGSHCPAGVNGLKLYFGSLSCNTVELDRIVEIAAAGEFVTGPGGRRDAPVFQDYVARLRRAAADLEGLKVVWDPGNGAAGEILGALTKRLGGQHLLTNEVIDGSFPCHVPDPRDPGTVAHLKRLVVEDSYDLGVALDGDGDCLGVLDGAGEPLRTDHLMALLVRPALADHPGARIVVDLRAGQVLLDRIAREGGIPVICTPSSSAIRDKMSEVGAPLGGRMDGQIVFANGRNLHDDAVLAALRMLEVLKGSESDLRRLCESSAARPYVPEVPVSCPEGELGPLIDRIGGQMADCGAEVAVAGGVRITTEDGWWALRPCGEFSGLIATLEARDRASFGRLTKAFAGALSRNRLPVPDFPDQDAT